MAELIKTGYKRLFEVRLLHHYWLDSGATNFDALPETQRNKLLLTYDSRKFVSVLPTLSSANKLKALKGVFRNTALGFTVAVPESTVIADDETFSFLLFISDPDFTNYTSLTFISHKIYELYYPSKDKILRFKENIPVFSNLNGVSRTLNGGKLLFLSKEIPAPSVTDKAEYFNITGGALVQLSGDQPGGTILQLSASAAGMPVFVHQNDTPQLVPPPGLTGTPEYGIELSDEIPDNVSGLIQIQAKHPVDEDFSFTAGGTPKQNHPVFQIRYKSRSAIWKYLNQNTGETLSETSQPLPFTAAGNAGANKRKPSASLIKVQFESNDPSKRVEKIYTEIFE